MKAIATGVIHNGRPRLDDQKGFLEECARLGDGLSIVMTVEDAKTGASRAAYGYYFGVVLKRLAARCEGNTIDDLHAWAKAKFTPKHVAICDGNGEIVDDMVVGSTTKTFDGPEFFEFVERLRQFMAERLGIDTPDPDPFWRQSQGRAA